MSSPPAEPRTLLAHWVRQQGWTVDEFRRRYTATAQALNARAATVSERQAKRWLAGTVTNRPHPSACLVLEALCQRPIEALMGRNLSENARSRDSVPDTSLALASPRDHAQPPSLERPAEESATPMTEDADDTLRFLVRAENASASEVIAILRNEVLRLSRSYGDHLASQLDNLAVLRKALFRMLDSPVEPRQARDIYFLAGLVCVMLAHASRDVGDTRKASIYQDAALLCADRSGHRGLRMTVRTEQAATSYWMRDYQSSILFTELAHTDAEHVHGSVAVLPYVQQARAYAALGDLDSSRRALLNSHRKRDHVEPDDLDEIGGLMRLSLPEQLGIVAGTAAWFPDARESERAAHDAVTAYNHAPHQDRSHNSEAIARADLAIAHVRLHSLDSARDTLTPLFTIPEPYRVLPIRQGMHRVHTLLTTDPIYRTTPAAHDLTSAIDDFNRSNQPKPLES